jgi:hypothetical protein
LVVMADLLDRTCSFTLPDSHFLTHFSTGQITFAADWNAADWNAADWNAADWNGLTTVECDAPAVRWTRSGRS